MKRLVIISISIFCLTCLGGRSVAQDNSALENAFNNPSQSSRPRVWWHWMNGNISKDGICKDLNWMNRSGIVGFHIFDAGLSTPQVVEHRIEYMTPEWKDAFRYALDVADSLGMEVTIASSPGWSETGGPWVLPDDAMKKLVWRQLDVKGTRNRKEQSIHLPEGFKLAGPFQDDDHFSWEEDLRPEYYKDIAVLAVRLPENDIDFEELNPVITTSCGSAVLNYRSLNSDSLKEGVSLQTGEDHTVWVQYAFEEAQSVKAIVVSEYKSGDKNAIQRELQVSDDGVHFRKVAVLGYQSTVQRTYSIPETKAKYFRLVLRDNQKLENCNIDLYQFSLSSVARIQDAGDKAAMGFYRLLYLEKTQPDNLVAKIDDVVDVTDKVKDGELVWNVPEGRWRIFRFGYGLYGKCNHPASPEATGLEVDKMDPIATERYYRNYLATYQDASEGRLGPGGIEYFLTDSFEAGPQTWTARMREEFMSRKGYDLYRWLPALTGMVLNSTQETERFLFDWRRCLGDMIAEYHYDIQNRILDEFGMKRYTESHESYRAIISDGMDCKKKAQIPMSAFWMSYKKGTVINPWHLADIRESASVSHIYGQGIVAAESFTANGLRDGAWVYSPARLKPTADAAMSAGLNRFVIHCSTHQPVDSLLPGLGLEKFGQWFTRKQTWADQASVWTDYLSRSCELLQKGHNVADIAVFYGEDNNITGIFRYEEPKGAAKGWNYDYFSASVLRDLAKAEDGLVRIQNGPSYKVLVIDPCVSHISIPVLRKIKELSDGGVLICGAIPSELGGLEGSQQDFDNLVSSIWKSGRRNVTASVPTEEVLLSAGVVQDVACPGIGSDVNFVHRSLGDGREIYWISSRSAKSLDFSADFRVIGKKAELWHADDASKEPASYRIGENTTRVQLSLHPYESVFVMFLEDADESEAIVKKPEINELKTISGPWKLTFQQGRGAPGEMEMENLSSLSENDNPGVKYYSGYTLYSTSFRLTSRELKSGRIVLDLGQVADLAVVSVNGKNLGTLWHLPFEIDVTDALVKGNNILEIRVANTWHNRILGDMQEGNPRKYTWYAMDLLNVNDKVLPSGLLGPVKLLYFTE